MNSVPYKTAEEQSRARFNLLSTHERELFLAKLIHAVLHDDFALFYAEGIVQGAEQKRLFINVTFGVESFKGLLFFNHKNSNMITDPKDKQEDVKSDTAEENAEPLGTAVDEESDSSDDVEGEE